MVPNCGKWQKTKIGLFNIYNYHYGCFCQLPWLPIASKVFSTLSHSSHHYISKNKKSILFSARFEHTTMES